MWYSMIGCLLTLFFGLTISIIINYMQKRRVLKITSLQSSNNLNMKTETKTKSNGLSAVEVGAISVVLKANEQGGHINHAIRLDDE